MASTPVQVSQVKAADPGFAFVLNFASAVHDTLKVKITIGSAYTSEVRILNPISDSNLVFVVPFGDDEYKPAVSLPYNLQIFVPENATEATTLSGLVMAESGHFTYAPNLPNALQEGQMLKTGEMMISLNGNYVGIMQSDSNFCVYAQNAANQTYLPCTDATKTFGLGDGTVIKVQNGEVVMINSEGKTIYQNSIPNVTQASLVIDANGHICLLPNGSSTPVRITS